VNFKKVIITLLISLAICGMTMSCVDATWVAHRGKYFKTGDILSTCSNGYYLTEEGYKYYKNNPDDWTQAKDSTSWGVNDDDWADMLRDLAEKGYCHCINYDGKGDLIYVFDNKTMAPGEYYEKYIKYTWGPDIRVRISVNNGKTSGWF